MNNAQVALLHSLWRLLKFVPSIRRLAARLMVDLSGAPSEPDLAAASEFETVGRPAFRFEFVRSLP